MMSPVTQLSGLSDVSLAQLAIQHTAIVEGIATISDQKHLINVCNSAFELLIKAADPDKLSVIAAMKVNFLAIAIGAGMNIVEMQEAADGIMKEIDTEVERRLKDAKA